MGGSADRQPYFLHSARAIGSACSAHAGASKDKEAVWNIADPILLGRGKRLFDDHTLASAFRLEESKTSPTGVLVTRYVREGEVRTASFESA
jgi:hypothetical protein